MLAQPTTDTNPQPESASANSRNLSKYRQLGLYITLTILAIYVGWWRLVSIAPGFSKSELSTINSSLSLSDWLSLPIQPLTHLGQWLVIQGWGLSSFGLRSVSVILGLASIVIFFIIIKRWTGTLNASLAAIMIGCSTWWLSLTRLATPDSEIILWLSLFILSLLMICAKRSTAWWLVWCLSMLGLAYNPGGIWIIIVTSGMILASRSLLDSIRHIRQSYKFLGLLVFILGLVPIGLSVIKHPNNAKMFLNINTEFDVRTILTNLWQASANLLAQLPNIDQAHGLSGSTVLRLVFAVMFILGVIAIIRRSNRLDANFGYLLIAILLTGVISSGLQLYSRPNPLVLLPAAFVAGCGIWYLTHVWVRLFPKNPYARTFGQILVCLLIGYSAINSYNIYSQTWAYSPATAYAFSPQLIEIRSFIRNNPANFGSNCQFIYDQSEKEAINLTRQLWGKLSNPPACQNIATVNTPNAIDGDQTLIFSAKAWQQFDASQQGDIELAQPHQPVVSDLSKNALEYWVFNPAQNPDIIDK